MIFLWYGQICVPVAVAILEECCMTFADIQKLFLSVERIVASWTRVHGLMTSQIFRSTLAFRFISDKLILSVVLFPLLNAAMLFYD